MWLREILAKTKRRDWRLIFVGVCLLVIVFSSMKSEHKVDVIGCLVAVERYFLVQWTRLIGRQLQRKDPSRPGYKAPPSGEEGA